MKVIVKTKKSIQEDKRKKIWLQIVLPISLIIICLGIFLSCWFGCNKAKGITYLTTKDSKWNDYFGGTDFSSSSTVWKDGNNSQLEFMRQTTYNGIDFTGINDGIIGDSALSGCAAMNGRITHIKGSGITAIGDSAFAGCTSLKSVEFNTKEDINLTIGQSAFGGCTSISHFNFGNGTITSIGQFAFAGCMLNLLDTTKIVNQTDLAANVVRQTGSDYAILWNTQTGKAYDTGCGCVAAGNIPITTTPFNTLFDSSAFACCAGINLWHNNEPDPNDAAHILKPNTTEWQSYFTGSTSTSFKTDGGYNLAKQTTYNCIDFTGITSFGDAAFWGCSAMNGRITHIKGEGVTAIGNSTFAGCTSLKNVEFNIHTAVNLSIGDRSFEGCTNVLHFDFGDGNITSLGSAAFGGCVLNLSDTIKIIDHITPATNVVKVTGTKYAILWNGSTYTAHDGGCGCVASGDIPIGLEPFNTIGDSAFDGCAGIKLGK